MDVSSPSFKLTVPSADTPVIEYRWGIVTVDADITESRYELSIFIDKGLSISMINGDEIK